MADETEVVPLFTPKTINLESSELNEEKPIDSNLLLKDLASDEESVRIDLAYLNILASRRSIENRELEVRFTGKTNQFGTLIDADNRVYFNKNGGAIATGPQGDLPLENKEQRNLLINLFENQLIDRETVLEASVDLRIFKNYIELISKKIIKEAGELEARFAGKTNQFGTLIDADNRVYFNKNGGAIATGPQGDLPLNNPDQQKLFIDIFQALNDESVSLGIRNSFQRYLNSDSQEELSRLRILIDGEDPQTKSRFDQVLKEFESTRRILTLKNEFYQTLKGADSVQKAIQILNGFDPEDATQNRLAFEFRNKALAVQRAAKVNDIATALASPDRDFNALTESLKELGKSPREEDKEAARVLVKLLYDLELATYREEVRKMISIDRDKKEIYDYINGLPVRPTVGEIDYIEKYGKFKDKVGKIYVEFENIKRLDQANKIRRGFVNPDVDAVLKQIEDFQEETFEDQAIKAQLFNLYKSYITANNPQAFDEKFRRDILKATEERIMMRFARPELGRNKKAFNYIRQNFVSTIFPLAEAYKNDPRTKSAVQKLLQASNGQPTPRLQFIQRLKDLEKQRPLTDIEKAYIESVNLLTLFNPYLVAVATADFGATNEFLAHHFDVLSKKTAEGIKNGDYIPAIQIGTGPDGLAAFGELVRNKPDLAAQTLVVDAGEQPGGPFAVPRGPAWRLNSANSRDIDGYKMPDAPNGTELNKVRTYGSPVNRWFPGERRNENGVDGDSVRAGSINTTVDYLLNPDNLSTARYATNEELQTVIALQSAMLMRNIALKTEVVDVRPNPNTNEQGNKLVKLRITNADGSIREITVKTDGLFVSSGLGEKTYGVPLANKKAADVIEQTKDIKGFPRVSTTLDAFRGLADRTEEEDSPGETLVIYGGGNSADTLIENIGSLFAGGNASVRRVKKIYVITNQDLSNRPRYRAIQDLLPRENGKSNLLEIVRDRVDDFDFDPNDIRDIDKRGLVLFNKDGKVLTNAKGEQIKADTIIAATGFKQKLDQVFASYVNGGPLRGENGALEPLVLPTNEEVAVAERFAADPTIVVLGTASASGFDSKAKLAQLPRLARKALIDNGAENAVAIGFRGPDTQAAVNIFLNSVNINLKPREREERPRIPIKGEITSENPESNRIIKRNKATINSPNIPNNIRAEETVLSPLLSYNLGNNFRLDSNFTGEFKFELTLDQETQQYSLKFSKGTEAAVSKEFLRQVTRAVADEEFQRYAARILVKRRKEPLLKLYISFLNGEINPGETLVE